jgi:hypothetical protein
MQGIGSRSYLIFNAAPIACPRPNSAADLVIPVMVTPVLQPSAISWCNGQVLLELEHPRPLQLPWHQKPS